MDGKRRETDRQTRVFKESTNRPKPRTLRTSAAVCPFGFLSMEKRVRFVVVVVVVVDEIRTLFSQFCVHTARLLFFLSIIT